MEYLETATTYTIASFETVTKAVIKSVRHVVTQFIQSAVPISSFNHLHSYMFHAIYKLYK
jgi:hypothetical protein